MYNPEVQAEVKSLYNTTILYGLGNCSVRILIQTYHFYLSFVRCLKLEVVVVLKAMNS